MKRFLIFLFFVFLMPFSFFGNEISATDIYNNSAKFHFQNGIQKENLEFSNFVDTTNILNNKVLFASKQLSKGINLALGIGFMVSGQLLFWGFGLGLIGGGVVLMAVHDRSYTWSNGDYASWVSPEKFNAGLACTIIGGICFLTGIAFIIAGGVNFGIAAKKKSGRRRTELFKDVFVIADYNMKDKNFILGARFLL